MAIPQDAFRQGKDVYIDYPQEEVLFHWVAETGQVFRKFYREAEDEIPHSNELFHESLRVSNLVHLITAEEYAAGLPTECP